jgi:hypothetical protein
VCVRMHVRRRLLKCILVAPSFNVLCIIGTLLTFNGPLSLIWCYPKELVDLTKEELQLVLLHVGRLRHGNDIQLLLSQLS